MKKIEEKLSEVCNLINSEDTELDSSAKAKIMETVEYLKDYARIQAASKLLSDEQGIKDDIESAKASYQRMIELSNEEIKNLPRTPRLKKNCIEEERTQHEKDKQDRANSVKAIRQNIKLYKEKIRKLESYTKKLKNPNKVAKEFFQTEQLGNKEKLDGLVNACVSSILDGLPSKNLVGPDKAFQYDGTNYKVNYVKAKNLLTMVQSDNDIESVSQYIAAENEFREKRSKLIGTLKMKRLMQFSSQMAKTESFSTIVEKMNALISMYNTLASKENGMFMGAIQKANRLFGINILPKRIERLRLEVAIQIRSFTQSVKYNPDLNKSYEAYQIIRSYKDNKQYPSLATLRAYADQIELYGTKRANIPTTTINEYELTAIADTEACRLEKESEEQKLDKIASRNNVKELYSKLSNKAKKLYESYDENYILALIKKYRDSKNNPAKVLPATLLQSLLERKNISIDNVLNNYADIFTNDSLANDTNRIFNNKLNELKSNIENIRGQQNHIESDQRKLEELDDSYEQVI